eukprot:TRINITY_DN3106_c3_g1_i1.p1 TRINITY_DN3106_c3_g1~~TRINITY_DN3106_c3_g1_i1.p1  ORF type:complete len:174 (+),score=49.91 TRINITY_DN3106_c3_g1_i1:116-637(+)
MSTGRCPRVCGTRPSIENMEALLSQFTLLANEACQDKNFDPSRIEDLMKLFEQEAYNSWAAMDGGANVEYEGAEISMREAEDYLNSLMNSAMEEFENSNKELNQKSEAELQKLVSTAEATKKVSESTGNAMAIGAKKYLDAALLSATASMKKTSAGVGWGGGGLSKNSKVHPS